MNIKNYEILAPAGSEESFFAAINSGADAIYLGLKDFSARSSADNFDIENLGYFINYAKLFSVKVFLTVNTLIKDEELDDFFKSITAAVNSGIDAVILQDIYLGRIFKKHFPKLALHLSTQAGVCNVLGALAAKENAFDRVILSRETPLYEIVEITKIIETEVFIQGALCSSFSGQCYLSSFIGGNSGNRGRCKQPCRKKYKILGEDGKTIKDNAYNISLSDLCVGASIIDLLKAGVYSFKIEGRMRRGVYVSAAISYYKQILDSYLKTLINEPKSSQETDRFNLDIKQTIPNYLGKNGCYELKNRKIYGKNDLQKCDSTNNNSEKKISSDYAQCCGINEQNNDKQSQSPENVYEQIENSRSFEKYDRREEVMTDKISESIKYNFKQNFGQKNLWLEQLDLETVNKKLKKIVEETTGIEYIKISKINSESLTTPYVRIGEQDNSDGTESLTTPYITIGEQDNSVGTESLTTSCATIVEQDNSVDDNFVHLKKAYNRGDFTKGYYFGKDKNLISEKLSGHKGVEIGKIIKLINGDTFSATTNQALISGDAFKILREGVEVGNAVFEKYEDESEGKFFGRYRGNIKKGDVVNITTDSNLIEIYTKIKKKLKVSISVSFVSGGFAIIEAVFLAYKITLKTDFILEPSISRPLTEQTVKECFLKTDLYPFDIEFKKIELDETFLSLKNLNHLRRILYNSIFISQNDCELANIGGLHSTMSDINNKNIDFKRKVVNNKKHSLSLIASDFSFLSNIKKTDDIDYVIFQPFDYSAQEEYLNFEKCSKDFNFKKLLYMPSYLTLKDFKLIYKFINYFDGYYMQGLKCSNVYIKSQLIKSLSSDKNYALTEYYKLLAEIFDKKIVFYGTGSNIFNSLSANALIGNLSKQLTNGNNQTEIDNNAIRDEIKTEFTFSKELTAGQIKNMEMSGGYDFILGNIEVMNLIYCPINNSCNNCMLANTFYLKDEYNKIFKVKKIKVSDCRFIVYFYDDLLKRSDLTNNMLNFTLFKQKDIIEILNNLDNFNALKSIIKNSTHGFYNKTVL